MATQPILSQAYGYGFILGIGAAFAIIIAIITRVLSRYLGQTQNSERFTTASRNVGSGLISSSTVSAWTWPATLLASGTWSYSYGIMGSFMYGIGGVLQITLFVALAIQLKLRAPSAHTVTECFHIRYGKAGHWTFLLFCAATNILVSSLLLLGGSQGFAATTGMSTVAASFLLPIGVIVYTALGGLKATFISDWIHTVIIYGIIIVAVYRTYCTSDLIGSPGKMYDLLQEVQETFPSTTGQSYLSFKNRDMMLLTWSVSLGGISYVYNDPGFSQRALASGLEVFRGYLAGAIAWYVIPACLGASAGLACRALLNNPASITYPNPLTAEEVDSALPVIYGLAAIFGSSGAAAGLVMIFMSVTSAASAELIAFSSILTYDVYRIYVNPKAEGKQLIRVAHLAVLGFGLFMAVLATVFNYIGVTAGWLLSFTGIIVSPGVSACGLTMFWPKMSKTALVIGAPLGTVTAVVSWVAGAYAYGGHIVNKTTLVLGEPAMIGNSVALFSPIIYFVILSYLKPDDEPFDFDKFNKITLADDHDEDELKALIITDQQKKVLKRQSRWSLYINIFVLLGCYVILPLGLYGSNHELSRNSFIGLIVVFMIWLVLAACYIILFPLWQGRRTIIYLLKLLLGKESNIDSRSDLPGNDLNGEVSEIVIHNNEKS